MRKIGWVNVLLLMIAGPVAAQDVREGPVVIGARDNGVGERVSDLSFVDLAGKAGRLSDYRDQKSLVICMTSASCPVARKYGPTLVELRQRFASQGVEFLLINAAPADPPEKINEAAAAWGGRYVIDRDLRLAGALGATSTTEVFVLDRARTMIYRGAIDDQYGLGYALPEPRRHFLVNALKAAFADQQIGRAHV